MPYVVTSGGTLDSVEGIIAQLYFYIMISYTHDKSTLWFYSYAFSGQF